MVFFRFWGNLEIQDDRPRWPPLKNDNIISMSCDVTLCRRQKKQFSIYCLPTKFHCCGFNALEVLKEGGGGSHCCPQTQERKKSRAN